MGRIWNDTTTDWTAIEQAFADVTARDSLVAESREAARAAGALTGADLKASALTLADLKASALTGGRMPGGSGVVPFAALKLYRSLLSRNAVAFSPMARAASTAGEMSRTVGEFNVNVIAESDATFLVIAPVEDMVPTRITLLGEDGRIAAIDLPDPIGEAIQIGLVDDGGTLGIARDLINDPLTSIFIQ